MADHESIRKLAEALVNELSATGKAVATAESCTGGMIAKTFTGRAFAVESLEDRFQIIVGNSGALVHHADVGPTGSSPGLISALGRRALRRTPARSGRHQKEGLAQGVGLGFEDRARGGHDGLAFERPQPEGDQGDPRAVVTPLVALDEAMVEIHEVSLLRWDDRVRLASMAG